MHIGAVDKARNLLKPGIPMTGEDGVPIRHEFEFELQFLEKSHAAERVPSCSALSVSVSWESDLLSSLPMVK